MTRTHVLTIVAGIIALASARAATTAIDANDSVFTVAVRAAKGATAGRSALTFANKGVQLTPNGDDPDNLHVLVSKDVGSERWAIALNADDSITGNVFLCDGSPPAFVWCQKIDDDHNADFEQRVIVWECFGAGACPEPPCGTNEQWPLINGHVQLTGAFFLP